MAAAVRVHAADPGAERETNDGERSAFGRSKTVIEGLLEAMG
jgi:hypothetical protein